MVEGREAVVMGARGECEIRTKDGNWGKTYSEWIVDFLDNGERRYGLKFSDIKVISND